jgi:hypothetical protein
MEPSFYRLTREGWEKEMIKLSLKDTATYGDKTIDEGGTWLLQIERFETLNNQLFLSKMGFNNKKIKHRKRENYRKTACSFLTF